MRKSKTKINLIVNDGKKRFDISINVSHDKPLSDKSIIRLVKLLARQAAREDYMQSIIHPDQGGVSHEKSR